MRGKRNMHLSAASATADVHAATADGELHDHAELRELSGHHMRPERLRLSVER